MISVIMPTYQAEKSLEACLASLARQKYPNLELVIIDKLSTDRTLEIAHHFAENHPWTSIVSEDDTGIYDAMNKGLKRARGEWIYFLGSDDEVEPEAFNKLFAAVEMSDFDLVYGDVRLKSGRLFDGEFSALEIAGRNMCHQAALYRRSLFERFGGFDTRFPVWADWEFNWRCFGATDVRRTWVNVVVAEYGDRGFSSTRDDEVLLSERPRLLFKYFKRSLSPDEMESQLLYLLPRYLEEAGSVRALLLMFRAGFFAGRLRRYMTAFWQQRSTLDSTRTLKKW